ncbi:MAG TPA: methylmalonyl Co-A mutase-associated GTPase MeaB [Stellaceae bacterium]|nr:methylmalonyl Co-A mutase-associated GTPase MeaB [Stellaceae bacterium]
MGAALDPAKLAAAVRRGDRRALARAITLAESTKAEHRASAEALLAELVGQGAKALRLGISGAPGVGKSTFIDAFGRALVAAGHAVAVLAVDPSSDVGGGSILGDKTRMPELAKLTRAFIRPSPAGKRLGGVARRTREAIVLVEAAGFDRVIVETVGVGQAEADVADMVDIFALLIAPGGGDELQGLKRGNLELADLVIVTKDDGDLEVAARRAVAEFGHALRLLRPHAPPDVIAVSALYGRHVDDVVVAIERRAADLAASGEIERRRARQAGAALRAELIESLSEALKDDSAVARLLPELEQKVAARALTPAAAAREALAAFLTRRRLVP